MNYIEYTNQNLQEYNKLTAIIESTKTIEQFEVVKNIAELFAHNCDIRSENLKKLAITQLLQLNLKHWKNYKSYRASAGIQVQYIIDMCNEWIAQYNKWCNERKIEEEEHKNSLKDKIDILGFSSLFKKNKKRNKK